MVRPCEHAGKPDEQGNDQDNDDGGAGRHGRFLPFDRPIIRPRAGLSLICRKPPGPVRAHPLAAGHRNAHVQENKAGDVETHPG